MGERAGSCLERLEVVRPNRLERKNVEIATIFRLERSFLPDVLTAEVF